MAENAYVEDIERLRSGIKAFTEVIAKLGDDTFLRPVTEWSPRDVTAHLIGWNVNTMEGCRCIQQGQAPAYLADVMNDFQHVNAASVRRYNSRVKAELMAQLHTTADALLSYLGQLAPDAWERDFGAREPDGQPATIRGDIEALAADYVGHAQEVASWAQK